MTGRDLLKKLSTLCYVLAIIGIILGIVAMNTKLGDILFQELIKNIKVPATVTTIEAGAFAGCTSLKIADINYLVCLAITALTASITFSICDSSQEGCRKSETVWSRSDFATGQTTFE